MNRFTKRLTSRRTLTALAAAGVLAAAAIVTTTTSLAQNRPERGNGGYDRRQGGGNGYGNGNDRQNFDRSRRPNNYGAPPQSGVSPTGATVRPASAPTDAAAATAATTQPSSEPAPQAFVPRTPSPVRLKPSDYSQKYVLLEQKNIFVKTRRPPPPVGGYRPDDRVQRKPEELLVLRGTALQDGRRVAFVENASSYSTSRLTPGSAILSGKIVEVGRDYITYEGDGARQTRIEVGHNFAGAVATAGGFTPSGSSSSAGGGSFTVTGSASASSSAAPPDPNNPNLSPEEKMKLRRIQEQQQQKPQ
jgi:hypothetical protein